MIALDTNVIVRFLVNDDRAQAHAVYARFRKAETARETLFVPLLVALETIWVLESCYDKSKRDILDAIEDLLGMPILEFEKEPVVQRLVAAGRAGHADLSDLLIAFAAEAAGCDTGLTFDKKAATLPFFHLLSS